MGNCSCLFSVGLSHVTLGEDARIYLMFGEIARIHPMFDCVLLVFTSSSLSSQVPPSTNISCPLSPVLLLQQNSFFLLHRNSDTILFLQIP